MCEILKELITIAFNGWWNETEFLKREYNADKHLNSQNS